jgi:acyl-CoA thioesterase
VDVDPNELARCAAITTRFNDTPYYRLLGLVASSDGPGRARVSLPFRETLTQIYGGVHGGALLSLADSAINVALATTFADGERTATVEIAMHFMAPAGPHDVVATASVTHRGSRLAFGECLLEAAGRPIARATGICHVSMAR